MINLFVHDCLLLMVVCLTDITVFVFVGGSSSWDGSHC